MAICFAYYFGFIVMWIREENILKKSPQFPSKK